MSWGPDGIVFGQGPKGTLRVSPTPGGRPDLLVSLNAGEVAHGPTRTRASHRTAPASPSAPTTTRGEHLDLRVVWRGRSAKDHVHRNRGRETANTFSLPSPRVRRSPYGPLHWTSGRRRPLATCGDGNQPPPCSLGTADGSRMPLLKVAGVRPVVCLFNRFRRQAIYTRSPRWTLTITHSGAQDADHEQQDAHS